MKINSFYEISVAAGPLKIDGNWSKSQWKGIPHVDIVNYMGSIPAFSPSVQAKMMYNTDNLFVIFHVKDRYVRCITGECNGPVWEDSCVEFFFAPDPKFPERYFNLEINCGGTPLMHYNIIPNNEIIKIVTDDIKKIEIAHSLPQIINQEITDPISWTIEYRIPVNMLKKYSNVTNPKPGIEWRANFYKIAENNSNPHYITWSVVKNDLPDFHKPQFFGLLRFR
jgi:hypothetical protein